MFRNLEAERARKDMTLHEIAEKLGLTVTTLSLKLRGKAPLTLGEAKSIKKILKVTMPLEELFEESEND